MRIELPYPHSDLNPNSRKHWKKKMNLRAKQKSDAFKLAKSQKPEITTGSLQLKITFHPPDKRKRDIDNMLAAFKGAIDGISKAWGIDDYAFTYIIERAEPIRGGKVVVEV